jgi:RNA-directed DNA polymerase
MHWTLPTASHLRSIDTQEQRESRLLGIPTVTDRLLQKAVSQVISPKFETDFAEHSYGFRPNRHAHQAVRQAQENIHEGYDHIVDIDLKNFFDEVDYVVLLQSHDVNRGAPRQLQLARPSTRLGACAFVIR